jgi:hypothetical protein
VIEVFTGNTVAPGTLGSQIEIVHKRFGLQDLVVLGDREQIANKQIDATVRDELGVG